MDEWHYETAADLDKPILERLKGFPREPDMLVYAARSLAMLTIRGWLRAYHRFTIEGREHLPHEGSFVMVGNHSSHLDALCLVAALPLRRIHQAFPAAAADYFFSSVPRIALAAIAINALPFQRRVHSHQSLALCRELLAQPGNILVLFPEGTRSTTGTMGEFKAGIGLLVAGLDVPVMPCYLDGAYKAWPKGRLIPRPAALRLRIGPAYRFGHLQPTKESALAISRELREAVQALIRPEP